MAQQLGAWIALEGDPDFVPSTHIWSLTAACNSGSREFNVLFWPLRASATPTQTHVHTHHFLFNEGREAIEGNTWF